MASTPINSQMARRINSCDTIQTRGPGPGVCGGEATRQPSDVFNPVHALKIYSLIMDQKYQPC